MAKPITITVMWKDQVAAIADYDGMRATIQLIDPVNSHHLFPAKELDAFLFLRILEQRCPSRNRPDIDQFLKRCGLTHYDVLEILRRTHGLKNDDYVWIKIGDEAVRYEDIQIRA